MSEKYVCILVRSPENWGAYFPDYAGCVAAGDTVEETLRLAAEALAWHLEEEPAVPPRSLEDHVRSGLELPAGAVFAYVDPSGQLAAA